MKTACDRQAETENPMITSEIIKSAALKAGADLCGIGDLARFDGAPKEMDPRQLFPEAKTVIGMVFRIPRGGQRGIEDRRIERDEVVAMV